MVKPARQTFLQCFAGQKMGEWFGDTLTLRSDKGRRVRPASQHGATSQTYELPLATSPSFGGQPFETTSQQRLSSHPSRRAENLFC